MNRRWLDLAAWLCILCDHAHQHYHYESFLLFQSD